MLLVFDSDIGNALSTASIFDKDVEASVLVRAAQIVRWGIAGTKFTF